LGQLLLSQLLDRPLDCASAYYRSRPFLFGCGLTLAEALTADMARGGSVSDGRDVGVVFNLPRRGRATVLPMAADVGSQFTPGRVGRRPSATGRRCWVKTWRRALPWSLPGMGRWRPTASGRPDHGDNPQPAAAVRD
jgi:hypothetical protein